MSNATRPVPRSALLFMATVDEARKTNEGPFRAIAPLFRIALEGQRGHILNIEQAALVLQPILGPNFTHHAVEAFLPQLVELGWLVREQASSNQAAYRIPAVLPAFDEHEAITASEERLARLHKAFEEFLVSTAPLLKIALTPEEFKWQIFRWATSLDGMDKDAVRAQALRLTEGEKPSAKNAFLDETHKYSKIDKSLSVEFAAFVKWLAKHERFELDDVASLTELGLAVEFLDELRSPTVRDDLKITTGFVLDAPVLLDLFGLSGPSRRNSIETCLLALKERGAKVITLTHCLDELSDILKAVLARPEARRFGLTGDTLRSNPELIERARQIASQPDRAAKLAGVEVLVFDQKSPLNEKYFEDELIDRFRNTATWHDLSKSEQRERDALSIAFIMRRRQSFYHSDVLDSRYVLVTRNSTFTDFSQIFIRKYLGVPDYAFGPAIETKTLAAFVWMRFGSSTSVDFPQLHLVSACDRILATNGELLRRAEKRLKALKGDDVAAALLSSQQAVLDLVISVGGSPDVLDAANGDELLRAFTASAEERGRLQQAQISEQEKAELFQKLTEKDKITQSLTSKAEALSADLSYKEAELLQRSQEIMMRNEADQNRVTQIAKGILSSSQRDAWIIVSMFWIVCTVVGISGQFLIWDGLDWWLNDISNTVRGGIVVICTFISAALSLRWMPPGNVDLAASISRWLSKKFIRFRLKRIRPTDELSRVTSMVEDLLAS